MSQRITIDPVTRIEGHLRIDCEIENGVVSKAWASGTMWRGMEEIVKNRDPRDAWMIVQRICGVCTTTHALSSVRAAESALNIDVPVNARIAVFHDLFHAAPHGTGSPCFRNDAIFDFAIDA